MGTVEIACNELVELVSDEAVEALCRAFQERRYDGG
jgi:hypothetical protein